jgi:hypothetical protein
MLVLFLAVFTMVGLPMAVRADRCNPLRMIRPTICDSSSVLGFQIQGAVNPHNRGLLPAGFTYSPGPRQHVLADSETSIVIQVFGFLWFTLLGLRSRLDGTMTKLVKGDLG